MTRKSTAKIPSLPLITSVLVGACALSALFIFLRFDEFVVGSVGDDAIYVEMARSIAEGRGPIVYLSEFATYQPFAFPAGYPLFISSIAWLFPQSLFALQIPSLVILLCPIPIYYLCRQLEIGRFITFSALSLTILNPWIIAYSNRVLSEAAYTFFSYLSLVVFIQWLEKDRHRSSSFLIAVVLTSFSISIRTVGFALVAAMLIHLLMNCKWQSFTKLALGIALGLVPQFIVNRPSGKTFISEGYYAQIIGHTQDLSSRIEFIIHNAHGYFYELPAALIPIFGNRIRIWATDIGAVFFYDISLTIYGTLIFILLIIGLWKVWRNHSNRGQIIAIYLLFYLCAILNFSGWPSGVQLRLLIPIIPLLYLLILLGLSHLIEGVHLSSKWPIVCILVVILAASATHNTYRTLNAMS